VEPLVEFIPCVRLFVYGMGRTESEGIGVIAGGTANLLAVDDYATLAW
jgi:hypothetical protein